MKTTTKADLVREAAAKTGCRQADCRAVIEAWMKQIFWSAANLKIEIRGFGIFYTKERKPRPARNPRTGAVVMLEQRRVFLFRYSQELIETIGLGLGLPYASPARFENPIERRNIAAHARAFIGEEKP